MANLFKWGGLAATPDEPEATLISFNIGGTDYQAVEGMTFRQWVSSSYNTGVFYIYEANNAVAWGEIDTDGTLPVVTGPANYGVFDVVYASTKIMAGGYYQQGAIYV